MKVRRKIGRGRRVYRYKGQEYINNHHAHNHLGTELWNPATGEIIYVKQDNMLRVR